MSDDERDNNSIEGFSESEYKHEEFFALADDDNYIFLQPKAPASPTVNLSSDPIVYAQMPDDLRIHYDDWIVGMMESKSIVRIDASLCIYIESARGWMPLRSSVSMEWIATEAKKYAPVNYAVAAEPILQKIERCTWPLVSIPSTFTLGFCRYTFTVYEDDSGYWAKFYSVRIADGDMSKSSYCCVPTPDTQPISQLSMRTIDHKFSVGDALHWIMSVFDKNMWSILWLIGDILTDFGNKRMFILQGPGGVGKSTVIKIITTAIGGNVPNISPAYLKKRKRTDVAYNIPTNQLLQAAASRMVEVSDLEFDTNNEINMQAVKTLTGGDKVQGVTLSTTILCSMNAMPVYDNMASYVKPDRTRRVVVIPSVKKRQTEECTSLPLNSDGLNRLVALSLVIRLRYALPPLTAESVLHTLFQHRVEEAEALVVLKDKTSVAECVSATMLLCWYFDISVQNMTDSLDLIGTNCCVQYCGNTYIARIAPRAGTSIKEDIKDSKYSTSYNGYNVARRPSKFFS